MRGSRSHLVRTLAKQRAVKSASSVVSSAGDARAASCELSIAIRLAHDGPEAAREPVVPDDLIDVKSETWLEDMLRKGRTSVTLDDYEVRVSPNWSERDRAYTGYTLEGQDRAGNISRRRFSLSSLEHVATRAAQNLISEGALQPHDVYYYELLAEQSASVTGALAGVRQATMRTRPLAPLKSEIGPLLRRATPNGPTVEQAGPFEVFYTEAALADAERCARMGVQLYPPVETGGLLVGFLCTCPVSGEFFAVVVEVLEAHAAEQAEFSLAYSSQTWARIQAVMDARQRHRKTRGLRILGQCHGHNFIPGDGTPPCEVCDRVPVCTRSSVFVSRDDWNWSRAVFRRQPWQLCHIFGLNARREQVQGLFGLRDGRLLERGFRVLPDFDLEVR